MVQQIGVYRVIMALEMYRREGTSNSSTQITKAGAPVPNNVRAQIAELRAQLPDPPDVFQGDKVMLYHFPKHIQDLMGPQVTALGLECFTWNGVERPYAVQMPDAFLKLFYTQIYK